MDPQKWKDKLYLVAVEMLKYGEPCQVSDRASLVFEDGRELVFEVMEDDRIVCRGIILDNYDGLGMTMERFIGHVSMTPFEIARAVSLAVLDKYTKEWENNRDRTQRKRDIFRLHGERAKELCLGLRVQAQLKMETDGISVVLPKGVIKVTDGGFRVEATFDVPTGSMVMGMNALFGYGLTSRSTSEN
jgi:hypothetical protein